MTKLPCTQVNANGNCYFSQRFLNCPHPSPSNFGFIRPTQKELAKRKSSLLCPAAAAVINEFPEATVSLSLLNDVRPRPDSKERTFQSRTFCPIQQRMLSTLNCNTGTYIRTIALHLSVLHSFPLTKQMTTIY